MTIVEAWPAAPIFSDEPYVAPTPDIEGMDDDEFEHHLQTGCWAQDQCEECREQARADAEYWDDMNAEYERSIRAGLR